MDDALPLGGARLDWGLLASWDLQAGGEAPADLVRMWQVAEESLGLAVHPIERFELAGTLNTHPGHLRSDEAKRSFPAIFALAAAGRTAPEPLRTRSIDVARSALRAWAEVYRPTGNPIDEWFFVPVLQAVDLVAGTAPADGDGALRRWAGAFASSGDGFYRGKPARNPSRVNNWMARRLLVRAVATTVNGDRRARAEMAPMLERFVEGNYVAGPSGVTDGRTYDFVQRDALHYHIAAVEPLVEVALHAPDLVVARVRAAVLSGLEFLRPFFEGERTHVEFVHTSVSFDVTRRDDGNPVFRNAPWEPARGRVVLRLARAVFPEIRPWTEDIVDHRYDPRTKLLAAIHGEPRCQSGWT